MPILKIVTGGDSFIKEMTLWVACKAVSFGTIIIVLGLLMTILGYFDYYFSEEIRFNKETAKNETTINLVRHYQLKSLQYIGPVLMGIGSFIFIIACVITLENRDKHAQILLNEPKKSQEKVISSEDAEFIGFSEKRNKLLNEIEKRNSVEYSAIESKLSNERKYPSAPCMPEITEVDDMRIKLCKSYIIYLLNIRDQIDGSFRQIHSQRNSPKFLFGQPRFFPNDDLPFIETNTIKSTVVSNDNIALLRAPLAVVENDLYSSCSSLSVAHKNDEMINFNNANNNLSVLPNGL
ncbi:unnamed protein product [Dracunculus medinensis]|uniref:Col_cuticle_N domain-containing protein n=1 Tax=Dracunculus medinensis TaxID=318479 RepID=A0A0N4UCV4_DRAME|nr:unnamed protein product [Dracunculus medinensis]